MQTIHSFRFLRGVLLVDSISSAAMAALFLLFTAQLSSLLSLPPALLREAGLILVPFAVFVGWLATREQPPRTAVWAVIAINAIWVAESALILLGGWIEPNGLGQAFIIAQALAVGVFAELQWMGLRKAAARVPA